MSLRTGNAQGHRHTCTTTPTHAPTPHYTQNKASHNELLEMYDTRAVMSVTVGDAFKLGTSKAATSFVRGLVMNNHNLLRDTKLNPYVGKLNVGKCLQTLHSPETQYEEKIWECTEVSTMPESLREQTRMAVPSIVTVTMHGAVTFKFDTESSAPTKIEHKKYVVLERRLFVVVMQ